jgi:signal transduction histidine kinase
MPSLRNKNIALDVELHSEWTLLNAIVQNLIENGIKYSRDKSPYVKVTVNQEDGHVVICVEDNGVGINESHQSRIFDMFYRATHNSGGSGLGLYILKRSVDRLEGAVDLESREGVGSTFRVKIPV